MLLAEYFKLQGRGAKAALARVCKAHPPDVRDWETGARQVPDKRAPAIEKATGGAVPCEVLCPEVTWVRKPDPLWPHPEGRPLADYCPEESA